MLRLLAAPAAWGLPSRDRSPIIVGPLTLMHSTITTHTTQAPGETCCMVAEPVDAVVVLLGPHLLCSPLTTPQWALKRLEASTLPCTLAVWWSAPWTLTSTSGIATGAPPSCGPQR